MTIMQTKTIFFAVLLLGLLIPFSGINDIEATSENNVTISEDECFDRMISSITNQEDNLELNELKTQANKNTKFQTLKEGKVSEFKNTIQYWTPDTDCSVKLKQIDVKYNLEKDTNSHKELIVSFNGQTKQIIKSELSDPYKKTHANNNLNAGNWAGITQMNGTSQSSSNPTKVQAYFDVPKANDPSSINCGTTITTQCVVSVWAGLTEDRDGLDTLVQSGTDSTCTGNGCTSRSYNAWLEKVDNDGTNSIDNCSDMDIDEGDSIRSYTNYYDSANKYSTGVQNIDKHLICSTTYSDESEDAHYGQFMVERPENNNIILPLPSFDDIIMKGKIKVNGVTVGIGDYNTIGNSWNNRMMSGSSITNVIATWPNDSNQITFKHQSSAGTK